jgi:hypothetical protein
MNSSKFPGAVFYHSFVFAWYAEARREAR